MLIHIVGGNRFTLNEFNEGCMPVQEVVDPDATIIVAMSNEEDMGDTVRATVIATGFGWGEYDLSAQPAVKPAEEKKPFPPVKEEPKPEPEEKKEEPKPAEDKPAPAEQQAAPTAPKPDYRDDAAYQQPTYRDGAGVYQSDYRAPYRADDRRAEYTSDYSQNRSNDPELPDEPTVSYTRPRNMDQNRGYERQYQNERPSGDYGYRDGESVRGSRRDSREPNYYNEQVREQPVPRRTVSRDEDENGYNPRGGLEVPSFLRNRKKK